MIIKNFITTIDTVTEGGPTRIITSGLPIIPGKSMQEKMSFFRSKLDEKRKLLMLEPAGYQGMFGAALIEPVSNDADIGVFFLTSSGYLGMCVHSAIGVVAALLETGMCDQPERGKSLRLDTPAGIIPLQPNFHEKQLSSISIQTNPAFVYIKEANLELQDNKLVDVSLVYSAVFFVLLDIKSMGITLSQYNIDELKVLGVQVLELANEKFEFSFPGSTVPKMAELVILYEDLGDAHSKNVVISRHGDIDRSPCGAGTGARMAYLFAVDRLKLNQPFINESIFDTSFRGKLLHTSKVGEYEAVVPQITGSAHITGFHQFVQ